MLAKSEAETPRRHGQALQRASASEHRKSRSRVRPFSLDSINAARARRRQRRQIGIVLDLAERTLAAKSDLHARDSECRSDRTRLSPRRTAIARHRGHTRDMQRRTQPSVAMLAGERATERCGQLRSRRRELRSTRCRQSWRRTSTSGFTWTCESPACPKITTARVVRARESRERRGRSRQLLRRNRAVLDELHRLERFGSSLARIGLAACRKLPQLGLGGLDPARREPSIAPHSRKNRLDRVRRRRRDSASSPSTSARSAASSPAGTCARATTGRGDVEKRPVEQLARDRAGLARAYRRGHGVLERRKRAEHAARRAGHRQQRELDSREQRQRPFAADEQVDELARFGKSRERRSPTNPSITPR